MIELTPLQKRAIEVLSWHNKENPILGKNLARSIDLVERQSGKEGADMRSVINALRTKGWPICASSRGYYFARRAEELTDFIEEFQGRINKQQIACDGMGNGYNKLAWTNEIQPSLMQLSA